MSKDIRSFFKVKTVKKQIEEEDDDVIPESPDVQIIKKKKESRKKRVLSDDSDDEIVSKKKKSSPIPSNSKNKSKTPIKPQLKEVKVVDLFGNGPIKRTEPLVKKEKKKTETGIHSDEEFERSLMEVDEIEESFTKPVKNTSHDTPKVQTESKTIKEESKKISEVEAENYKGTGDNETKHKKDKKHKDTESNDKIIKIEEDHVKKSVDAKKENGESSTKREKKRDFSEFISGNESGVQDHNTDTPKSKKTRVDTSLNESVLTDEERHERKMHSAALYQKYLNRSGPKHLGTKQIPEGSPGCLSNCAFLLTGVLDSFEREEVAEAITNFGGCIKNSISKKVTHVLAGEDAGPAKMAKAQEWGIKIINEDEFLQLIIDNSRKTTKDDTKKERDKTPKSKSKESVEKHKKTPEISEEGDKRKKSPEESKELGEKRKIHKDIKIIDANEAHIKNYLPKSKSHDNVDLKKTPVKMSFDKSASDTSKLKPVKSSESLKMNVNLPVNASMWVDKYKPQNIKQIIGQHGDASNVKKLINWLSKWYVNRKAKLPKPSPWAKNDDGGFYKAALLSGPPGVGKTTTVALVCKELGFDMVEFNASDTRNKSLIREQIGELLTTNSLAAYAKGDTGKQAVTKKHVLIMDEVDGMAGNEDRGGMQELIGLIKSAAVPIVCMCNDRNSQKMRALVNYCYDLRFSRPRVDQIKAAMMSICCKEGVKIPSDALTQLIIAANQDIRQTLNLLSMWAVDPTLMDADRLKKDAGTTKKDIKLGPWEAIRKVFSAEDHKSMSIIDKSDLFFYDYSLAPLFVQENYLNVSPHCPKHEVLQRLSEAAESISSGDLVDSRIRRNQAWGLLPMQAMFSSVIPGHHLSGHVSGQIQFPGWLGKNSRATKMHRLCQEIHAHTRLSTSGSKSSIYLDYCTHLRNAIVNPLIKDKADGVAKSLEVLESYHLLREDLDSLLELSVWPGPGQRNPMDLVDSKIKAAMTRAYNKNALALPYAPGNIKKGRAKETDEGEDEVEDDDTNDSDPENDALIKKKKPAKPTKEKAGSSKEKAGSSKEKSSSAKDKPSTSRSKKK